VWIKSIYNPIGDGNWGFHCLAKVLGYNKDGWKRVREEMIAEIKKNKLTYVMLLGGTKEVQKILDNLVLTMDDSNPNTPKITCNNWLSKLSHGHIVSNTYVRPIFFLSLAKSITFLPLKLVPKNCHSPI
jgi:hypothetical protein